MFTRVKRVRPIAICALVAFGVAACGDTTTETTVPTTTPATTPVATVAPTTTTTTTTSSTTTTLAPQVGSDDFVTTVGLGPIRIGSSVADAEILSGIKLVGGLEPEVSESCYFVVPEDTAGLEGIAFLVDDGLIGAVYVSAPSPITTGSGAAIGTTEQELIDLFGDQLEDAGDFINDGKGWVFVPQDEDDAEYRVVFEMDENDAVRAIRAGILPAVGYNEGCA